MDSKVKVFSGGGTTVIVRVGNKNIYVGVGVASGGNPGFNELTEQQLLELGYREMTVKRVTKRKSKTAVPVPPAVEKLFKISELPVGHVGQSVIGGHGGPTGDSDFRVRRVSLTQARVEKAGFPLSNETESVHDFINLYRDLGPASLPEQEVAAPAAKKSHATC